MQAGIVVALVVTLPLASLRGVAHADLGDEPSSKSSSSSAAQADDADKPKDPSLLDKTPADAAVAQKAAPPPGPPFYAKWQFWAIAGAVVVGAAVLLIGGIAVAHQVQGGDVRPCNMDFQMRCFGEGH